MSLPMFAELEAAVASLGVAVFGNINLLVDGTTHVSAVLNRSMAVVGEYGYTGERRDRITLLRSDAAAFASGQAVVADPSTYTAAEITAMGKSSWKLDHPDGDDGNVVSWWLK